MRNLYRIMYRLGITPWDSTDLPAPVIAAAEAARPRGTAHAVDLGCGTGAQALLLAGQGWHVTAVDYLSQPITTARARDRQRMVDWRVADVTRPAGVDPHNRLAASAALILDNGCLHGIPGTGRAGWAATVNHLAAPGCVLLVRATGRRGRPRLGPTGIQPAELSGLLRNDWNSLGQPTSGWHHYVRRPTRPVQPSD